MGMTLHLNKKCSDQSTAIEMKPDAEKTSREKPAKAKPKRDWIGIIHRGCRVCMFRALEGIFAFFVVTIFAMIVGSLFLPSISFSMATTAGITQSTDFYTATALWLIPMLFFVLLTTAAVFCVLRRFLHWLHKFFSNAIRKDNEKDAMRRAEK